jgi:hypothetical protein
VEVMAQAAGLTGITAQIQQITAYWRTRIEAIRTQWLGKLGGGGLIPKPSALVGFAQPSRPAVRRGPSVITSPAGTSARISVAPVSSRVGVVGERYDMSQKILVPGESYDFSYKSRRVGAPGERYDFTY